MRESFIKCWYTLLGIFSLNIVHPNNIEGGWKLSWWLILWSWKGIKYGEEGHSNWDSYCSDISYLKWLLIMLKFKTEMYNAINLRNHELSNVLRYILKKKLSCKIWFQFVVASNNQHNYYSHVSYFAYLKDFGINCFIIFERKLKKLKVN